MRLNILSCRNNEPRKARRTSSAAELHHSLRSVTFNRSKHAMPAQALSIIVAILGTSCAKRVHYLIISRPAPHYGAAN